jgi:spermidine/putrescine transport system substrate-binding protein
MTIASFPLRWWRSSPPSRSSWRPAAAGHADGAGAPGATTPAPTDDAEPTDDAPPGRIVVSNWDGYMPPDLLDNFTAETGVEVELALHTTNEDIMGKLEAANGGGFDVVFVSAPFAEALHQRGWAAQLDHARCPNLANLVPRRRARLRPGQPLQRALRVGHHRPVLSHRPRDEEIDSWADLLSRRPSCRARSPCWPPTAGCCCPPSAPRHSINTTDEAELRRPRAAHRGQADLLAYDDTTFYSRLVSGEAVLVEAWDGWCNYGIAENAEIGWVVPEEGSDLWVDTMVVLESSQNKAGAQAFIDYVLRPTSAPG